MSTYKRIASIMLCLALVLMIGGEFLLSPFAIRSSAATSSYSDVLSDLSRDKTFDINNYPDDPSDKSLKVISIAEGINGELFIYVYQPCNSTRDYRASYINMATEQLADKNIEYKLYSLTWLNSSGVFDKYLVNDFTVKDDSERFYNIAGIYRPFESDDDYKDLVAVDTKQFKSYSVAQAWSCYYYNKALVYEMEIMNVVEYTVYATGSVRYNDGFYIGIDYRSACDSHYIAFKVENYDVEKIFDADISYTVTNYKYEKSLLFGTEETTVVSSEPITKTLSLMDDPVTNDAVGLFGKNYQWNRIQDVDSFKEEAQAAANEPFSEDELIGLSKSDFVFRFEETDFSYLEYTGGYRRTYGECSGFGIFRISFLSEGDYYNLGAVGDLVGTDSIPELDVSVGDNIINSFEDGGWWSQIMMVLGLIILLLLISIFIGPIVAILKMIWNGIKFIGQCFLTVIITPIKYLVDLLRK